MRNYKYIGMFRSHDGDVYHLQVVCGGFLTAFFLLTADAIRSGKHYQLAEIKCVDNNETRRVASISNCSKLLTKSQFLLNVE